MRVERAADNPIVHPGLHPAVGDNVNGPCLIRVPDWLPDPLGRYYLYFSHHKGDRLRLAFADRLPGPWRLHAPGCLAMADAGFDDHVASPDVLLDHDRREVRLYFHGKTRARPIGEQETRLAVSADGLRFTVRPEPLGPPYWRLFRRGGFTYAHVRPDRLYRSPDGLPPFEPGPALGLPHVRHAAVDRRGDRLWLYFTNIGDCPEQILRAEVRLSGDWHGWRAGPPEPVLRPELPYEGADCPLEPSRRGEVYGRVHQLRDPYVFREDGRVWLLYAVAGEAGIALAELREEG